LSSAGNRAVCSWDHGQNDNSQNTDPGHYASHSCKVINQPSHDESFFAMGTFRYP
jgi:hypothetical protein